jgi:hypothetical protein
MDLDPLTFPTIPLPAVWSPVREKSDGNPLALQIEEQAKGSLLVTADTLESVLRLLLGVTEVERVFSPPDGYDAEQQGEWDEDAVTFAFTRGIRILSESRSADELSLRYEVEGLGTYTVAVTADGLDVRRE